MPGFSKLGFCFIDYFIDSPAPRRPFGNVQFSDEDDDFQDEEMKRARLLRTRLRGELSSFMNLENHHPRPRTAHFQTDALGPGCL